MYQNVSKSGTGRFNPKIYQLQTTFENIVAKEEQEGHDGPISLT